MQAWLLALALAALDGGPSAPAPPAAAEAAPPEASAVAIPSVPGANLPPELPEVAAAPLPDRRGPRNGLALGEHSTTFFSKEGSQYTFHSASLGYLGSFGSRGPFVHAFVLVPLQARQDGHVYATSDYYRRRNGGDLLAGWQWRWTVRGGVEAEAGPGLHATIIYLPGKPGYRDFSAVPFGLGVAGVLRWPTRARRFSRPVTVGTYASVAYDFRDPLHADDLAHGFTVRAGLVVGVGARP